MHKVVAIKNGIIENVIVSDSLESVSTLGIFLPNEYDFVLQTDETGIAFVGGSILEGKFVPPSPYNSWIFNQTTWSWESPVPYPDHSKSYMWSEDSQAWVEVVFE